MNVSAWLDELGLGRYAPAFAENDIDEAVLPMLTDTDLRELGVSLGHRKRILAAIAQLYPNETPAAPVSMPRGGAERRQLTVMFCDLVDSTTLADRLDPEELRQVIASYQSAVTDVINRYGGHVAQYLGDGVMVYFGWPSAHEDDAQRAVRAALDVIHTVRALKSTCPTAVRIGIATGLVVIGEAGSGEAALRASAVGETPNLAARLQGLAPTDGIIVNHRTHVLTSGAFESDDLGPMSIRGVAEPVRVFRIIGTRHSASRFAAAHESTGPLALVGREMEMSLLHDRWQRALAGERQAVLIMGEAGIGKSRLLHALTQEIDPATCYRLHYQCSPFHTDTALFPIIEHFASAARFDRTDPPARKLDKLEELIRCNGMLVPEVAPLFANALSIPTGDRYARHDFSAEKQNEKAAAALLDRTIALAARKPVLLVFEDLHWCDPSTSALLDGAIEAIRDARVMLIGTARTGFAPPWKSIGHVTVLSLNRLGQKQAAEIVDEVAGDRLLAPAVRDEIVAKAEGVPLFLEELTKGVLDCCPTLDQACRDDGDGPPIAIPPTIQDSLMARLDRLGPVREVAQVAAAIGRSFDYDLLSIVCKMEGAALDDALERLLSAEIIHKHKNERGPAYLFKHALIQEAAYESLLRSARQALHRQIAEALASRAAGSDDVHPEILAYHFTRAGHADAATKNWLLAGRRALHRAAYVEAAAHLRRGIAQLDGIPDGEQRLQRELELRMKLGPALAAMSGWHATEAKQNYDRTHALSRQIGNIPQVFTALWGIWLFHAARGETSAAGPIAGEILSVAKQQGDGDLLLQAHHAGWANAVWAGEMETALGHITDGMSIYDSDRHSAQASYFGGHDAGVCAKGVGSVVLWTRGEVARAMAFSEESFALAARLDHAPTTLHALMYASLLHHLRREPERVATYAEQMVSLANSHGIPLHLSIGNVFAGWAMVADGEGDAGLARMRAAFDRLREGGARLIFSLLAGLIAEACLMVGRPELGLAEIRRTPTLIAETGELWWQAELHRLEGILLLAENPVDTVTAEEKFRAALSEAAARGARSLELRAATTLAALLADKGRTEDAQAVLAPVLEAFPDRTPTPDLAEATALLAALDQDPQPAFGPGGRRSWTEIPRA